MAKILAKDLKVGDIIMPPQREVSLWMRKELEKRNLPESALYLKVEKVEETWADKKGPWLLVTTTHSEAWNQGRTSYPWKIKIRPNTLWPLIQANVAVGV